MIYIMYNHSYFHSTDASEIEYYMVMITAAGILWCALIMEHVLVYWLLCNNIDYETNMTNYQHIAPCPLFP